MSGYEIGVENQMETGKQDFKLPPKNVNFETYPIYRILAEANRTLGELKGQARTIPNQTILIDAFMLQEAKVSSEIENIVTTHDELFQAGEDSKMNIPNNVKEVLRYREVIKFGYFEMKERNLITNNMLIKMFRVLLDRDGGFRVTNGTNLRNEKTSEVVYTPPQDANEIVKLMSDFEKFVNDDRKSDLDPMIKMAIIHHQFESIHPFPDGNGRIGRILNVLYLTRAGLIDLPILYLSRHIQNTKAEYCRLLQAVRDTNDPQTAWEDWVVYILEAVTETSKITNAMIESIREQMAITKHKIRTELPKIYSQELLNNIFKHPYTQIKFVASDLGVTRQTASKYLDQLVEHGIVQKLTANGTSYFVNAPLVELLKN